MQELRDKCEEILKEIYSNVAVETSGTKSITFRGESLGQKIAVLSAALAFSAPALDGCVFSSAVFTFS